VRQKTPHRLRKAVPRSTALRLTCGRRSLFLSKIIRDWTCHRVLARKTAKACAHSFRRSGHPFSPRDRMARQRRNWVIHAMTPGLIAGLGRQPSGRWLPHFASAAVQLGGPTASGNSRPATGRPWSTRTNPFRKFTGDQTNTGSEVRAEFVRPARYDTSWRTLASRGFGHGPEGGGRRRWTPTSETYLGRPGRKILIFPLNNLKALQA